MPDELATPHPRFARDRWPERLAGRAVRSVDAHGKHLFLRFEGDLTIHSHLRMTGSWRVFDAGRRWTRSPRAAWLVLRRGGSEVVQFNGPVLELMTESRTRFDQRIAGLGPDILAPEFDYERYLRRLREDDPTRPIGDAVLEQRTVAGIGNLWKVEACFEAGIDPWRPTGKVSDDEAVRDRRRRAPAHAAVRDATATRRRHRRVYGRAGLPCPRCGARVADPREGPGGRQPHDVLVPAMSELTRAAPLRRVGHKGADLIAPGNTRASFDAALAAGVDMIEFDVLPRPLAGRRHDAARARARPRAPARRRDRRSRRASPTSPPSRSARVELDVDLKLPGYEERSSTRCAPHGLVERALVSSQYMRSLVAIRALEPRLRLGWSVPRVRRDYTKSWLYVLPALSALAFMRRRLPRLAAGHVGAGRVDAVMAHQRLATPALLRGGPRRGRRALRVDDRRRRARSAGSRRWASTPSSPTTRGCSSLIRQVAALKSGGIRADRRVVADLGHAARAAHDRPVALPAVVRRRRAGSACPSPATSKLQPDSRARRDPAPARVGVAAPSASGRRWRRGTGRGSAGARCASGATAATPGCRSRPGAPRCRRRSRSPTACARPRAPGRRRGPAGAGR